MEKFLEKFDIETKVDSFAKYYEGAKKLYDEKKDDILDFERYNIFTYMKEDIARIRDEVAKDSDNVIYAYFLYLAMEARDAAAIRALSCPNKKLEDEKYDFLPMFSLLYCVPALVKELRSKGVPEDIIDATLNMYENQTQDFVDLYHRYGISIYVGWMMKFVRCEIIRVGRFNFEICNYSKDFDVFENNGKLAVLPKGVTFHRSGQILGSIDCEDEEGSFVGDIVETDTYYEGILIENGIAKNEKRRLEKSEWKKVLTKGDRVINYHIPTGGKLDHDECEIDIQRGKKIINECFGGIKGFFCLTWIIDPQIKEIMGRETNLTKFADRFEKFPLKSQGHDIFEYVFVCSPDTPLEELPEKSGFAKAIKQHLLNGGRIWGAQGVAL